VSSADGQSRRCDSLEIDLATLEPVRAAEKGERRPRLAGNAGWRDEHQDARPGEIANTRA